jgi:peptide-methionine (S)-S-oxide reductase
MLLLRFAWVIALVAAACSGPAGPSATTTSTQAPHAEPPTAPAPTLGAAGPNASDASSGTAMPTDPSPAVPPTPATSERATLANGCFWCTEAVLERLPGVLDVTSGYMGGASERPTYEQVCTGTTGHAECVDITFDPSQIRYEALLEWFFKSHDPTTLNRQGADEGTQYRSAIFFHTPAQQAAAKAAIAAAQPGFRDPIVTEVTAASRFWPAETYHQDFFRNNPQQRYCRLLIVPKLQKLGLDAK